MESALGWIGDLAQWVANWFPHLAVVKKTHAGVKFVRGWKVKIIEPGLHWYWPITTELLTVPVVRQSLELVGQTLACADGQSIYISTVMVYHIHDPEEAIVHTWDFDRAVEDVAQHCTSLAVQEYDRGYLLDNRDEFIGDLFSRIADELTEFGITLQKCGLVNLTPVRVYRVVMGG